MSAEYHSSDVEQPVETRRPGRGVYWLPNLFTTGTLFGGFYAIVAAIDGNFSNAGIAIFVAMIADGLDGRVARWTNTQSDFGKEYDSICDMVAFGLAPAIVVYQWGIERIYDYGKFWGRFGWLACFFYAVAAALRLARFNTRARRRQALLRRAAEPVRRGHGRELHLAGQRVSSHRACRRWRWPSASRSVSAR